MRSVRSTLVGLGTLTILLTFVGFATFSPNGTDSRPETPADPTPTPVIMAADAGAITGRVTAFVFANQLQGQIQPEVQAELTMALLVDQGRQPLSASTTTQPPTTTAATTNTTAVRRTVTTTTQPPAATTTTAPPATTTTTTAPPATTTTTMPPATTTTTAPPATTTTTEPPSGGRLSEGEMRALATQYFPAEEVEKAVLVARCESNYDPSAIGYVNDVATYGGLFQHSLAYWEGRAASAGWAGASIYDAAANTAVAAWLFNQGGWGHWPWCSAWADAQLGG